MAVRWYEQAGARVIARNFRLKCGELDLVVEEQAPSGWWTLIFVEVRSRTYGKSWDRPEESLTLPKLFRIRHAAERFLQGYQGPARSIRFDLASWNHRELKVFRNFWWY
ncbi:MAG: hypothetical protein RJB38_649 [Pseudomonadota bacterium]